MYLAILKKQKLFLKAVKQNADFVLTPVSSKITLDKNKLLKTATSMDKDIYLKK